MLHRPIRAKHYSRYVMGLVFLGCGLLLATVHLWAGSSMLVLALVVLYYAPRWDLRIEIEGDTIRFSENVVEIAPLELRLADIREIRRVSEREERKGLLSTYPEYLPFVEFETRSGMTFRMHDIFSEEFDDEVMRAGTAAGIHLADFPRED